MSALAFNPWTALKIKAEDVTPARVANSANPVPVAIHRLATLAGLAGGAFPLSKMRNQSETMLPAVATEPNVAENNSHPPATMPPPVIPLAEQVEAMAQAMMSNPVYRVTNPEKAMEYFRANALTRLTAVPIRWRGSCS